MVKGVDRQAVLLVNVVQDGVGIDVDGVCGFASRCVLTVFYEVSMVADVLFHMSAKGHSKSLDASTDAKHRYLSVEGQSCDE